MESYDFSSKFDGFAFIKKTSLEVLTKVHHPFNLLPGVGDENIFNMHAKCLMLGLVCSKWVNRYKSALKLENMKPVDLMVIDKQIELAARNTPSIKYPLAFIEKIYQNTVEVPLIDYSVLFNLREDMQAQYVDTFLSNTLPGNHAGDKKFGEQAAAYVSLATLYSRCRLLELEDPIEEEQEGLSEKFYSMKKEIERIVFELAQSGYVYDMDKLSKIVSNNPLLKPVEVVEHLRKRKKDIRGNIPIDKLLPLTPRIKIDGVMVDVSDNTISLLYERYRNVIFTHLFKRTNYDMQAAEDLLSQTFLKVLVGLRENPPQDNTGGWIFTIAENLWIDQLRLKRKRPEVYIEEYESNDRDESDGERVEFCDSRVMEQDVIDFLDIEDLLNQLPESQRNVMYWRFVDGYTSEEIAQMLGNGVTEGSIKVIQARAQKNLRKLANGVPDQQQLQETRKNNKKSQRKPNLW